MQKDKNNAEPLRWVGTQPIRLPKQRIRADVYTFDDALSNAQVFGNEAAQNVSRLEGCGWVKARSYHALRSG